MAPFGKSTTTSILVSFFLPIASCIPEWERLTTKAQDATMMFWTRLAFCSLIWGNTCEKWITVTDSVKTHCQVITSSCRTTTYYLSKGQFCFLPLSLPPLHHHASVSLFASFFTLLPPLYVRTNPYLTQRDHRVVGAEYKTSVTYSLTLVSAEFLNTYSLQQQLYYEYNDNCCLAD